MKKKTVSTTREEATPQEEKSNFITFSTLARIKQDSLEKLIIDNGALFITGKKLVIKITRAELS